MTTYSDKIENFLNEREMPISKKLAKALIENFGGEEQFLADYQYAARDIRAGYGHFVYNKAMVDFYRKNKKQIKKAMVAIAEDYGHESVGDFAWAAADLSDDWTKNEIMEGIYKDSKKPFHDLDLLLNLLYVWQVQLLGNEISMHYEDYLDQVQMNNDENEA